MTVDLRKHRQYAASTEVDMSYYRSADAASRISQDLLAALAGDVQERLLLPIQLHHVRFREVPHASTQTITVAAIWTENAP